MKELIRALSISEARSELLKATANHPYDMSEYLNGKVFENQVIAYTEEMNWSINEFIEHILKINGVAQ